MIGKVFSTISFIIYLMVNILWSIVSRLISFLLCPFSAKNVCAVPKELESKSLDSEEYSKYIRKGRDWWGNPTSFLRTMNAVRVPLIRDGVLQATGATAKKSLPLEGYKIIDVGCGGGLLAEPLAELGAQVTGLDPVIEGIEAAKEHAAKNEEVNKRLNYVCDTIENLVKVSPGEFDAVCCSEVVEHVVDVESFVKCCVGLAKEGGSLFFTTWNRTAMSYFTAIWAIEYIFKVIPKGTHEWSKFMTPTELSELLQSLNCRVVSVKGMHYDISTKTWNFCDDTSVWYGLHVIKL